MQRIEQIVDVLNHVRLRRDMYFDPINAEVVETFLHGFSLGCLACGFHNSWETWHRAVAARGWKVTAASGPVPEMRARGLSEDAIIDELIAIQIDAIRLAGESEAPLHPL